MLYRLMMIGIVLGTLSCNSNGTAERGAASIASGKTAGDPLQSVMAVTGVADADSCPYYYHRELKKKVYTQVTEEAEYPGGSAGWQRFLNKNLRYPQESIEEDVPQTSVRATCIIDSDGTIKDIRITGKIDNSSYSPLDKEFIRVIKLMPKWYPAKCGGKTVAYETKRLMIACLLLERQ